MKESTYALIKRLENDLVVQGKQEVILGDTSVKLMSKLHQLYSGTIKFESGNTAVLDYSKAIRIYEAGGPEVLKWENFDPGKPEAGEALVRHEAVGLNFIDVYHRTGLYPVSFPFVPGIEGSGTVEAAGEDTEGFEVGDRVAWANGNGQLTIPARPLA